MLKWLIRRKLRAFERANGYDAAYMHEVLNPDVGAFLWALSRENDGSFVGMSKP